MPHLDAPKDRPFPFVYFISIINNSAEKVTIFGRKWILKEEGGETLVFEGEGVVGEFPVLNPGERFSYNSYHVIKTRTVVTGSFFGKDSDGGKVVVHIPGFDLEPPGDQE
ncbi:MAG: ApaG domain [Akkermansiaceae bacterium]|nr:ApaG domain [Akkermansiaceae bacterium]